MTETFKKLCLIVLGFGSGVVIAGGVFAFIAVIGIVPRLAQKTRTESHVMIYEDMMVIGGVIGTLTMFVDFYFPVGKIAVIILSFAAGIFFGCMAVSLAEVLDVIPVFTRHARIKKGLSVFIVIIAAGKLIGSVLYNFVPNFY
jgi:stage V sporulation protein AB